jgi:transcriptional regulator with XRE-family HTH domain
MTQADPLPPQTPRDAAEEPPSRDAGSYPLDMASISHRIARRREQFELKQLDLARQVGMSEAYINRLENGVVRNPKILDLALVAQALDLPLNVLLYGESSEGGQDMLVMLTCPPRLARALANLMRGLQHAEVDQQEHVIRSLESLAWRLDHGPLQDAPS